ncbi:NADH:flavin oxidoreductase/NADH oxidase [Microbacterium betulae]|uniref:NADH:flavin oxidoreductase/NADH oxidase n=1 Tax=Microbacterium betulae TaxID=2981139 RepID=A0AA97FI53_9MICO|nr:NADH:flavin oxidoreductase/NADH oxidase [Microbacterium sp. AB]WOF23118.1 NADH:flavin oxidoreductase/NADH oxidase [Microbacterium sp. AB]
MTAPRSALFRPLRLRDLELRNRVGVSPMCMYACEDRSGRVHAWHVVHYGQFALGGAALVVTEATAVLAEGRVTPRDAGLWDDAHVPAWRAVVDAVHRAGAAIAVQLAHAGRKGGKHAGLPGDPADERGSVPPDAGGWVTAGASGAGFGHYAAPRRVSDGEIEEVVDGFRAAAGRAVAAGFDAVELHAAHGYLLHEFLSPVTNTRDDRWGADRELLLLRTVDAVREVMPAGMPLLVRLSVDDVAEGGLVAADSAALAGRLRARGVDLVDCSSGGLVWGAEYDPSPGYQVPGAAAVRASGATVAAVGLICEPAHAEAIVRDGLADVVLLGRAMLRDPHWARRAQLELEGAATIEPRYHRAYR